MERAIGKDLFYGDGIELKFMRWLMVFALYVSSIINDV